jgi:hypothetical protein
MNTPTFTFKTSIHFEVLNLSKMVLNYRKNFVESCTINFVMQTAIMGTENRFGFHFRFNLGIKMDMMTQVPAGRALPVCAARGRRCAA